MPTSKITLSIQFTMIALAFALPISIAVVNFLSVLLIILWFIEGDMRSKIAIIKQNSLLILPLVLPLLFLLSWIWSDGYTNSFLTKEGKSFIRGILPFLWIPIIPMILVTSVQKKYAKNIVTAFLSAIFISELASYLIYFELIDWQTLKEYKLLYRASSPTSPTPFMHHIRYSIFLGIALLLLIDTLRHGHPSKWSRIFLILFIISATVNLFINGGRTGQIGIVIGLTIYTIIVFRKKIWLIFTSWIAMALVVSLAYHTSPIFQKRVHQGISNIQGITKSNYDSSWGQRMASIYVSVGYLKNSPANFFLGAGAGNSRGSLQDFAYENYPTSISENFAKLSHLHNQYLQLWIDGGIAALLVFMLYFYKIIRKYPYRHKALIYGATSFFLFAFGTNSVLFGTQAYLLVLLFYTLYIIYDETQNCEQNCQSSNKQTS